MKKLTGYIIVFLIGFLLGWYICKVNTKPEIVERNQTKIIYKLKKKIAIEEAKEKEGKFLWLFNKDNMIWCGIGYAFAIL